MLRDIGTRILYANKKMIIAMSKASVLKVDEALGNRILTERVIFPPCNKSPTENPKAPRRAPNLLVITLEPTAGPTQAERLLPATSITDRKTRITSTIDAKNIGGSLENRGYD